MNQSTGTKDYKDQDFLPGSQEIFEKNLHALKRQHSALLKYLRQFETWIHQNPKKARELLSGSGGFRVEQGKRGLPTIKATDATGSFYLHSLYDPFRESAQLIQEQLDQRSEDSLVSLETTPPPEMASLQPATAETAESNLTESSLSIQESIRLQTRNIQKKHLDAVVILGLGLGYSAESLYTDFPELAHIIVVEPDDLALFIAFRVRDMSAWVGSDRLRWIVQADPAQAARNVAQHLDFDRVRAWKALLVPAMVRRDPQYAKVLIEELSTEMNRWYLSISTQIHKGNRFLTNSFENFLHCARSPGINSLNGRWKNKPFVLVAAGPSLEKQLPVLQQYADRCFVAAVSQALPALAQYNIRPHCVLVVDDRITTVDFEGTGSGYDLMAIDIACNPAVVSLGSGKLIVGHALEQMENTFREIYGPKGIWGAGGSVATNAFVLGILLQASPIILIGQDLALTGGQSHGKYYRHGNFSADKIREKDSSSLREIDGYHGDRVITTNLFDSYRGWYEETIRRNPRIQVINATEGGARIAGTQQMAFRECLEKYALRTPVDHGAIQAWAKPPKNTPGAEKIIRNLVELRKQLLSLERKSTEGIRLVKIWQEAGAMDNTDAKEFNEAFALFNEIVQHRGAALQLLQAQIHSEIFLAKRGLNIGKDKPNARINSILLIFLSLKESASDTAAFLEQLIDLVKQKSQLLENIHKDSRGFEDSTSRAYPPGTHAGLLSGAVPDAQSFEKTHIASPSLEMQAYVIQRHGGPEVFEVMQLPQPHAGPGQVRIRVQASSVNPIDTKIRCGLVSVGPEFPAVLHGDVAGILDEVGAGVTDWQIGDAVVGCPGGIRGYPGALAEYMVVDARLVAPAPKNLSLTHAATLPLVFMTAWDALVTRGKLQAGEQVLIHAGAGGVGHVAIQLAKALGATVATTVSSPEKAAIAKSLGADDVILYRDESVAAYVQRLTQGQGFPLVFDTVGGSNLDASFQATAVSGRVCSINTRSTHDLSVLHARNLSLHVIFRYATLLYGLDFAEEQKILREMIRLIEAGQIRPWIDPRVFRFDQIAAAHQLLESGEAVGKILLLQSSAPTE